MLIRHIGRPQINFAPDGEGASGGAAPSAPSAPAASPSAPSSPSPSSSTSSGGEAAPASLGSPSVTPSPPPTSTGAATGEAGDLDFSAIFGQGPEPSPVAVVPAATPVAEPPAVAVPPVGAEPPKPAAPPAVVQKPVEGAVAAPGPQEPGTVPASPPLDLADPVALARVLRENESTAVDHLAKTMFNLSNEDLEALEADVAGTVPKLLARTFVKAKANILEDLGRLVPQMIQRQTVAVQRNAENEAKFFARWPELEPVKHNDLLRRYAVTYRSMHPQVTAEQMIEDLGPLIMMAAKVQPRPVVPGAVGGAAPGNGTVPKPQPFVPAQGGPAASATTVEAQSWDVLDPSKFE